MLPGLGNNSGDYDALGAKLRSLDDIPKGARAALEKKTPEIFDLKNWGSKPRNDFAEYMQKRRPT